MRTSALSFAVLTIFNSIEFTATGNGQVNAMADFSTSGSWSSSKQKQVLNKKILSTAIVVDGITIPIRFATTGFDST